MAMLTSFLVDFLEYLRASEGDKLMHKKVSSRDLPRFFDQVGHRTTNASIENKHFFTK